MGEIIEFKITEKEGKQLVSAKELHEKLELKKKFTDWIKQYVKEDNEYLFEENVDFIAMSLEGETAQGNKYSYVDYAITFDMAKEISMVTKNEQGKKCRKYFIEKEKELKSKQNKILPTTYKEALKQLLEQVEENEKLLEDNNKLSIENEILNGKNYKWIDRNLINALVRRYGCKVGDFRKAWTEFKKNLLYKYSININARKTAALNKGTKKVKTLDMIADEEMHNATVTILSMLNEIKEDVSDILVHAMNGERLA